MSAQAIASDGDVEPSPAAAEAFSIDVTEQEGQLRVTLAGDFDLSARDRFYEHFEPVRASTRPVVLDVSGLDFVDTIGLGCLCYARNALFQQSGHAPKLAGATPTLHQLLVLSGIDDLFDWEPSKD